MNSINFSILTDEVLEKYQNQFEDIFLESGGSGGLVDLDKFDESYRIPVIKLYRSGLCNIDMERNNLYFNIRCSFVYRFRDLINFARKIRA